MIKLVYCARRRPELTVEEFQRYWLERHGPLVRSLRQALPEMRRYVQSHTVDSPVNDALRQSRGAGDPYDGITEVWLDVGDGNGFSTTDEAVTATRRLIEDEATFIDLPRCSVFLTQEHEIF